MTPRVGQWLYATCSALDYGEIVAVGKDPNGVDCIDIRLCDVDEVLWCHDRSEDEPDGTGLPEFGRNPLVTGELPPGVELVLKNVQYVWHDAADRIECWTPGDGCHSCQKAFLVRDHHTPDTYGKRKRDGQQPGDLVSPDESLRETALSLAIEEVLDGITESENGGFLSGHQSKVVERAKQWCHEIFHALCQARDNPALYLNSQSCLPESPLAKWKERRRALLERSKP